MSQTPWTLDRVTAATSGQLLAGEPGTAIRRVVTDSRRAGPGDLFVALSGPNFDGHDFLTEAVSRGVAAGLIAADQVGRAPRGMALVLVDDPRAAYGLLAGWHRRGFEIPVTCVAGSNGKTTTKDLLATLLATAGPTLSSEASHNNDVGVPGTLLRLDSTHRAAVLEAGTNHPGELEPLIRLIQPRFGILTSIGREHLEFFGDLEGVAREEGVLGEVLPAEGLLVLPDETPFIDVIVARTRARVVRLGGRGPTDWAAVATEAEWRGTVFEVTGPRADWCGTWQVPLPGRHSVLNALAALVVAAEHGIDPAAARGALAAFQPPRQRLNVVEVGGVRLLDDTYNANADSMGAALQTLSDLPCAGRRVAVLGDMAELGSHAGTAHGEVGRTAAHTVDALFTVGQFAEVTATAARGAGLGRATACADVGAAVAAVVGFVRSGDTVLVKASRSGRLERVAAALKEHLQRPVPA